MASFDNTKYDIALYPQAGSRLGYRLSSYQRSEFSPFIPRLGSGDQSESEFDAIKSLTFSNFESGEFARTVKEDTEQYAIEGLFPSYGDGVLWQTNHATQSASFFGTGRPVVSASCRTKEYAFVAVSQTSPGTAQRIYRIDASGTKTSLTLPTNLSSVTYSISDMIIHNNQLWVCASNTSPAGTMYYMDLTSTTLTEVVGGTGYFYQMVVWNGALYGTNASNTPNYVLYKYTGDTVTKSFQELAKVPTMTGSSFADMLVYNGRVLLTRHDGLYAYDGIRLAPIEDAANNPNVRNYRFPSVLRGYLYYWMPDGMYRYNGASIEKLYDVNDVGYPTDMISARNRLWLVFANSAISGSSRYDKALGYNYTTGSTFDARLCAFDGKGMFTYTRMSSQSKSTSPMLSTEGEPDNLIYSPAEDKMYISTFADPSSNQWLLNLSESSVTAAGTGTGSWQIVTPVIDAKFPMINKALASVELVLDGVPTADDTVTVEYRTSGFEGSTGWTTLGTILLSSRLKLNVFSDLTGGVTFKNLQLRLRPATTTNTSCGFSKLVVRYVLMPEFKYEWLLTVNCYGDDTLQPLLLADGTQSTQTVSTLRGNIYHSRSQQQPLIFVDVDQVLLSGALTSSATSLVLDDAQLLKSSGYVMIDDEIIYYGSKNGNTLGSLQRGVLVTSAASHTDASKVFIIYPTIIKRITADRVAVDDRGTDFTSGKARASEITFQLQEL